MTSKIKMIFYFKKIKQLQEYFKNSCLQMKISWDNIFKTILRTSWIRTSPNFQKLKLMSILNLTEQMLWLIWRSKRKFCVRSLESQVIKTITNIILIFFSTSWETQTKSGQMALPMIFQVWAPMSPKMLLEESLMFYFIQSVNKSKTQLLSNQEIGTTHSLLRLSHN